jgi:hypothetical protein
MRSSPRRIVANLLLMPAFKVGNPVEAFILMKSDNFARDAGRFCSHGLHMGPFYAQRHHDVVDFSLAAKGHQTTTTACRRRRKC